MKSTQFPHRHDSRSFRVGVTLGGKSAALVEDEKAAREAGLKVIEVTPEVAAVLAEKLPPIGRRAKPPKIASHKDPNSKTQKRKRNKENHMMSTRQFRK